MVKYEVGDLIEVYNAKSTGFKNGEVGLIVKIEQITKEITIYWTLLGNYEGHAPFWAEEIRLLSGRETEKR
jgi:hypothetical protein